MACASVPASVLIRRLTQVLEQILGSNDPTRVGGDCWGVGIMGFRPCEKGGASSTRGSRKQMVSAAPLFDARLMSPPGDDFLVQRNIRFDTVSCDTGTNPMLLAHAMNERLDRLSGSLKTNHPLVLRNVADSMRADSYNHTQFQPKASPLVFLLSSANRRRPSPECGVTRDANDGLITLTKELS